MYEYQCRCCGCMMDPGEGRNGMCDDCVTGETELAAPRGEDGADDRATEWTQLEVEDFLNESKVM